jgi:enoyl-CoA hydratase/carnithine racemase
MAAGLSAVGRSPWLAADELQKAAEPAGITGRDIGEGVLCDGVVWHRLDHLQSIVITKTVAGFDKACIGALSRLMLEARSGRLGSLKFLVMDFAHPGTDESVGGEGFNLLVSSAADLILEARIVSIACGRAHLAGADLEFALGCSMLIGEQGSEYSFAADPLTSLGTYGFLSQKIGFVRAERLMEGGEVLGVEEMRKLLLLKEVLDKGAGLEGIERFLHKRARRHNSCYGIYRAQRIAAPSIYQHLRAFRDLRLQTYSG